MDSPPTHFFTEVGNGTIDFMKILSYSHKAGLKYFFVEQDVTPGSPFDSIQKSYDYIKKNLVLYVAIILQKPCNTQLRGFCIYGNWGAALRNLQFRRALLHE